MIKLCSVIILFCSLICANTIQDTLSDTTTNHYDTEIVSLMGASNLTIMIDVTDASVAGFSSDSIDVLYGFQIGHLTLDTLGQLDTAWTGLARLVEFFFLKQTDSKCPVFEQKLHVFPNAGHCVLTE